MDQNYQIEQNVAENSIGEIIDKIRINKNALLSEENGTSSLAYPGMPPQFTRGEGIYLIDDKGQHYLDGASGTFNISLGYAHPDVSQAVSNIILSGLSHISTTIFTNEYAGKAATALVKIAPNSIDCCHFKGCTGSTAMEQAMRSCLIVTGQRTFVGFQNGHHGQTMATTAISGMPFRRNRLPILNLPVVSVPPPDCYRCPVGRNSQNCKMECINLVKNALDNPPTGEKDVCAFIAEPILGAGGGIMPPINYWPMVQELLHARNIPLIFDEVQTFGRTGHFFAAQYFQVEPDLITLAKGISGIGIPGAGAVLSSRRFAILKPYERSLTWGGSPLICAAIATTIEVMQKPEFFARKRNSCVVPNYSSHTQPH
jgi:4-aminobutyrate aminotransferase-like enzyme